MGSINLKKILKLKPNYTNMSDHDLKQNSSDKPWYANNTFVIILLILGILLLLKEVISSYLTWNPLSIIMNIAWIVLILFVIIKIIQKRKNRNEDDMQN